MNTELLDLINRDALPFSEFEALYTRLVNNGDWSGAAFLTALRYLQAKYRSDAETPEILALLKTTVPDIADIFAVRSQNVHQKGR